MLETVFAEDLSQLAPTSFTTFGQLVSVIVKNVFVLAGIVSLFLLIFGGFNVIVAAGDPKKSQQGKTAITGAVTGLLLIFGSFWIIQIIEVITGRPILNSGF